MPSEPDVDPSTVPLRVRHFVNGASVLTPPSRVRLLDPVMGDGGRRGVPLASPAEVDELLERCGVGLARWLAMGAAARTERLLTVRDCIDRETLPLADALADDCGITCETAVGLIRAVLDLPPPVDRTGELDAPLPGLQLAVASAVPKPASFMSVVFSLLEAGSTVVIRPAPTAARSLTLFVELASDAGLPDGVLNVVHGDRATIEALLRSPYVAGLTATGPPHLREQLAYAARVLRKRSELRDTP